MPCVLSAGAVCLPGLSCVAARSTILSAYHNHTRLKNYGIRKCRVIIYALAGGKTAIKTKPDACREKHILHSIYVITTYSQKQLLPVIESGRRRGPPEGSWRGRVQNLTASKSKHTQHISSNTTCRENLLK